MLMKRWRSGVLYSSSCSNRAGRRLFPSRRAPTIGRISSFARTTLTPLRFRWSRSSRTATTRYSGFSKRIDELRRLEGDHRLDGGQRVGHVHSTGDVEDQGAGSDAQQVELDPYVEARHVNSCHLGCPLFAAHGKMPSIEGREPPACRTRPRAGHDLGASCHGRWIELWHLADRRNCRVGNGRIVNIDRVESSEAIREGLPIPACGTPESLQP